MRNSYLLGALNQPDPRSEVRLGRALLIALFAVAIAATTGILAWIFPPLRHILPDGWAGMSGNVSIAALAATVALALQFTARAGDSVAVIRVLAIASAVPAIADLVGRTRPHPVVAVLAALAPPTASMPWMAALAFLLLAAAIVFLNASSAIGSLIGDLLVFATALVVLALLSVDLLSRLRLFGVLHPSWNAGFTLWTLALLAFLAFSLRAQHGAFNVMVGRGISGRIARSLTPILLLLPFLRESLRAKVLESHLLPEPYAVAILASTTAMLSLVLLIVLARYIRRMEQEIHDLSLRDELTGLYNLRGFRLLAEHGLRMAQRSGMPFSVLFVDLDGLKQINDRLGHGAGSAFLIETAELLKASFREVDVIARIGGDEFAVAGQFSRPAIAVGAKRLEEQAKLTRLEAMHGVPLSLSLGHVTNNEQRRECLQDLLDKADAHMYDQKRRKKFQIC